MKAHHYIALFVIVAGAATLANLLTLKIAADQVTAKLDSTGATSTAGALSALGSLVGK
jgi:hypothetical protein